jgi:hypothetical protein
MHHAAAGFLGYSNYLKWLAIGVRGDCSLGVLTSWGLGWLPPHCVRMVAPIPSLPASARQLEVYFFTPEYDLNIWYCGCGP